MLDVKLAEPQKHQSLTVFPLVYGKRRELPYTLLGDALEAGTLKVTEVGSGSVPELMVENVGDADVLILDGEQLIGAKQNRMTNRSIILAAHTKTPIPVSCMEQGRWHMQSRSFDHTQHYSPSKVRRHARKTEALHVQARQSASHEVLREAQGDVWNEIADYSMSLKAESPTGNLDHVYDERSNDLEDWTKSFAWVDDQVGILAFVGDEPLGIDIIGCHKLYASLHKRLLSGYIMDALASRQRETVEVGEEAANSFLENVRAATRTEAPTVGRGTYRVLSERVMGGELEEGELVHLSAFPAEDEGGRSDSERAPIRSPRYRRRRTV